MEQTAGSEAGENGCGPVSCSSDAGQGEAPVKETIFVVHGTFAGPRAGVTQWYEPGSPFCEALDEALAAKGSAARCWAHLEDRGEDLRRRANRRTPWFSWSGANHWIDRASAADSLLAEISRVAAKGWRWNVVAHSHGGNVLLEALALDRVRAGIKGKAVLLGTPILRFGPEDRRRVAFPWPDGIPWTVPRPPVPGREAKRTSLAVGLIASLPIWLFAFLAVMSAAGTSAGSLLIADKRFWIAAAVGVPLIYLAFRSMKATMVSVMFLLTGGGQSRAALMSFPPRLLFVNSANDEAFRFLTAILAAKDPLRGGDEERREARFDLWRSRGAAAMFEDKRAYPWSGRTVLVWLLTCLAAVAATSLVPVRSDPAGWAPFAVKQLVSWSLAVCALALLICPGPLVAAASLPWRVGLFAWRFVASALQAAALRRVRRRAWRDLRRLALGLVGSPHRIEDVAVLHHPDESYAEGEWLFEPLAPAAEAFAISERRRQFADEWQKTAAADEADMWNVDGWHERVGRFAGDASLVHTVYYRHPDAIEQIAAHLARDDDTLVALMRRRRRRGTPHHSPV